MNKFTIEEPPFENLFTVDDTIRQIQIDKINNVKANRDNERVKETLLALEKAAIDGSNVMPKILDAVEAYATLGEICDVMRGVFGEYTGG